MPPRPTTEQFLPPACAYDERGQKVAEWGTAVQPAAYEYDDAGRLVALTRRIYTYDKLGRPTTRQIDYPARQTAQEATFGYNDRSELTSAQVSGELYGYDYDNIGKTADGCKAGWTCAQHAPRRGEATRGCRRINRRLSFGGADYAVYTANELNQYTQIDTDGSDFTPEYDADGNQTLVQTATGIWHVTYNAQNRAIRYESEDGTTVITCGYDYMGRRFEKKVEVNGETTLHEGYIYHGYLQIACVDLQKPFQAAVRYITWDPTQSTATRPLALQQNSVWYTYKTPGGCKGGWTCAKHAPGGRGAVGRLRVNWDLIRLRVSLRSLATPRQAKNICELYNNTGYILNLYSYTPYGLVTANSEVDQPIQWSSEMHDTELGLVYYNYRYYNPVDGRWIKKDSLKSVILEQYNDYAYVLNAPYVYVDVHGLYAFMQCKRIRTEQSFYYECKMYIYGPCNNRCCEDETKAAGDAKDVETLEAALSKLRSCMAKNNSGSLDVEVTDHIYANLGENAESTTEGDPYGSSGPLPEGTYRILPRSTGIGRYPLGTPSITGLDQDVPGEVVTPNGTNRNCLFVHGPGKSEGCLAMQNNMEITIKKTMDSQSTCGGTYLQIIGE